MLHRVATLHLERKLLALSSEPGAAQQLHQAVCSALLLQFALVVSNYCDIPEEHDFMALRSQNHELRACQAAIQEAQRMVQLALQPSPRLANTSRRKVSRASPRSHHERAGFSLRVDSSDEEW